MASGLRTPDTLTYVHDRWPADVLPLLETFARIPNRPRPTTPAWEAPGHMEEAADLLAALGPGPAPSPGPPSRSSASPDSPPPWWSTCRPADPTPPAPCSLRSLRQAAALRRVDRRPGPLDPVIEGDWLYARGVADDGYALPSALLALEAVRRRPAVGTPGAWWWPRARRRAAAPTSRRAGPPGRPDRRSPTWSWPSTPAAPPTTGCGSPPRCGAALVGTLTVRVLEHGVHSGSAGAVVPSSFRILRLLLDRIEDAATGDLLLPELQADLPARRRGGSPGPGRGPGRRGRRRVPVPGGGRSRAAGRRRRPSGPCGTAWRASLATVGADGLPPTADAGTVLRPFTSLKLAIRIPPTADPDAAADAVARALTTDPPYGATVTWDGGHGRRGLGRPTAGSVAGRRPRPRLDRPASATPPASWARAGPSRSWAGWPRGSPRPSSWPPGCSARVPTPTAPTSLSTCPRPSGWVPRWPSCSTPTPAGSGSCRSRPGPVPVPPRRVSYWRSGRTGSGRPGRR